MSIIPVIVKRRKSIVDKFAAVKALDNESARLLEDLELKSNNDIEFLLLKGTLVKTEDGKYYLDERKKFFD